MSEDYRFIVDLGGTNIRIGLVSQETKKVVLMEKFLIKQWETLEACLMTFLDNNKHLGQVHYGAIAFAGLQDQGIAKLTNSPWAFSKKSVKEALNLKDVCILNDFEAIAHGLPYFQEHALWHIGGEGAPKEHAPKVVFGAGTGLGCSYLIHVKGKWVALSTEMGFTTLAGTTQREEDVLHHTAKTHGENLAENMLSGQGIMNIYKALTHMESVQERYQEPSHMVEHYQADSIAQETIEVFLSLMGTFAANTYMSINAQGGVYIAGGIAQKLQHAIKGSKLLENFQSRGGSRATKSKHNAHIKKTPLYLITEDVPAIAGLIAKVMEL